MFSFLESKEECDITTFNMESEGPTTSISQVIKGFKIKVIYLFLDFYFQYITKDINVR